MAVLVNFITMPPHLHIKKQPPKPGPVYDTYWRFAAERQAIFFRRMQQAKGPWTADPVLQTYKFTNAYRAADRVSQYLIKEVIYKGNPSAEETFFRILLFKTFNKIDTWQLLQGHLGELRWATFTFDSYNEVLQTAMDQGERIYSAAYIMTSGRSAFGHARKHRNHLALLQHLMETQAPRQVQEAPSLEALYQLLKSYPTLGPFLAFQYAIDLNYSPLVNFSEMDFVVPGPGALRGIRKCFAHLGDYSETGVIDYMAQRQAEEFERLGLEFQSLWGRPLQLVDCQNLFCEVDKYARVAHPEVAGGDGRKRIKQQFLPRQEPIAYYFPPKWGITPL